MLGVIHAENHVVRLVRVSWNYPTVDLGQKRFEAEERCLRETFISPLVFSIDQKIQDKVKEGKEDMLDSLTMMNGRDDMVSGIIFGKCFNWQVNIKSMLPIIGSWNAQSMYTFDCV